MNTLEIILILIGIIIIVISSRLVDRSRATVKQPISGSLSLENSFSEEEIRLETAEGDVCLGGKGLVLKVILPTDLRIEGELSSLSFEGGKTT